MQQHNHRQATLAAAGALLRADVGREVRPRDLVIAGRGVAGRGRGVVAGRAGRANRGGRAGRGGRVVRRDV